MPVWCQGPIIPIDIAKEDVASSSEGEVLSDDSAVAESDED